MVWHKGEATVKMNNKLDMDDNIAVVAARGKRH